MMHFEFATANRIIFGSGVSSNVGTLAVELGDRALVVVGVGPEYVKHLLELLDTSGLYYQEFYINQEPTVDIIHRGVSLARQFDCNLVISVGGGSAIDTGKAVAAMISNPGDIIDYLEVVGQGKPLIKTPVPFIAVPTTAGTGAEVTRNAVLGVPEFKVKVSLRSPLMIPDIALVDPELTLSMPPSLTASSGLDALTQIIEPYVSNKANPITDAVCIQGLKLGSKSLHHAYVQGDNLIARENMSMVSLFSGLALANAKLGAVHGIAGPFGGMYDSPHGAVCARLLPFVMESNVNSLRGEFPESESLKRYADIAVLLTANKKALAEDGVKWVHGLCKEMNVPPLRIYGMTRSDIPALIDKSQKSSSMKGNPVQPTQEELRNIIEKAL
jgi:alcohol dehydrogenase class IV